METGKLFVFSAPSGSGKTTLVRHLLLQNLPLGFSISAATRHPRGEEKDGVDYYFLSEDVFPSLSNLSIIIKLLSLTLLDNADLRPSFLTFLLSLCSYERFVGP